ncbi:MAG: hypothetical protein M1546_14675 [Chloroflexi bacterium]|nr:hypothetical protein [Chloroflexota bacterium]
MTTQSFPDLTTAQIDSVLAFLPTFEQPGYKGGEWHAEPGHLREGAHWWHGPTAGCQQLSGRL